MKLIRVLIGIVALLFALVRSGKEPKSTTPASKQCDTRAKRLAEVGRLEAELEVARAQLYSRCKMEDDSKDPEVASLKRWSRGLWLYLVFWVLCAAICVIVALNDWALTTLNYFSLAAAAGVLGAGLSGLLSLNERVANGWEFPEGTRAPDPAQTRGRFNLRMVGGFLARPLLGLASGPLAMTALKLGELIGPAQTPDPKMGQEQIQAIIQAITQAQDRATIKALAQSLSKALAPQDQGSEYQIFFFSFLGGLLSKTLFDWLKDRFRKVLG